MRFLMEEKAKTEDEKMGLLFRCAGWYSDRSPGCKECVLRVRCLEITRELGGQARVTRPGPGEVS